MERRVEILFDGQDLALRTSLEGDSDAVAITFTPRGSGRSKDGSRASGFGEAMFLKEGIPFACFVSKKNHWWQSAELAVAVERLAPHLAPFQHVVSYGTSMGAYGALLLASLVKVDHVLACSPQVDMTGALPLHPTWASDLEGVPRRYGSAAAVPPASARVTVVMDPGVSLDGAHFRVLAERRPVERLCTPFAGHSSALFLSEIGLLKVIVLDVLGKRFDLAKTRNDVRRHRTLHPVWCERAASWLEARGEADAAEELRARAVETIRSDERWADAKHQHIVSKHIRLLLRRGKRRQAKALINRLIESGMQAYSGHLARANLHILDGQARKSIPHARRAAELRPTSAQPYIALASAMIALSNLREAERFLEKAVMRRDATPQDWQALAASFTDAGATAPAARAAAQAQKRPKKQAGDPR